MSSTTFSGPVTSTGGFITGSDGMVSQTAATLTVTSALHAGRTILLARAAGITCTLPAAAGTGNSYNFLVTTTFTGSGIIKVANASDIMTGIAHVLSDAAAAMLGYSTAADTDTITLNGTTSGGYKGATVTLTDVATNLWAVSVVTAATGSEETPFSATV